MKSILYATDFSENAEKALPYAIFMASVHRAKLVLLHLYQFPLSLLNSFVQGDVEIEKSISREALCKLKELYHRYSSNETDIPEPDYLVAEKISEVGDIITIALEKKADLLVIGKDSTNTSGEMMAGNTAKQLIKQAPCPVLAIPMRASGKKAPVKLVYATDLLGQDIESLANLADIMRPFDPEIIIVHIVTFGEGLDWKKLEWFKELIEERIVTCKSRFQILMADDVYQRIIEYLLDEKADLVIMLEKHYTGFFNHQFHGDLVMKMEMNTVFPLMTFNERYLYTIGKLQKRQVKKIKQTVAIQ